VLELEATTDILLAVSKMGKPRPQIVIGFAAESRDLLENAAEKLKSKRLDMIAANDISAADSGFHVDTNRVTLLYADGHNEALPLISKSEVAEILLERSADLLENG
jgi:phosphopantothenoylcysteine decarboxylase/phosphopantothenate--cysteine ligase